MADFSEILKSALSLGLNERAALAEELLASLEKLSGPEADRLWAEEAVRRREAYRAGIGRLAPAEEVHRKAEKLLR